MSYIFLAIAAMFNAIMDTLTHHFSSSVFKNKNEEFWNPNVSWKFATFLPFTRYKVDAWHLSKSAMVVNICLAIVSFNGNWWEFFILGLLWNFSFNIFYNTILRHA